MMNIRSYRKMMRELAVGETFYMNAINCSIAMIDYTKELIKAGKIAPVQAELDKMIKPEAQAKFITGDSICPQMDYIVLA